MRPRVHEGDWKWREGGRRGKRPEWGMRGGERETSLHASEAGGGVGSDGLDVGAHERLKSSCSCMQWEGERKGREREREGGDGREGERKREREGGRGRERCAICHLAALFR